MLDTCECNAGWGGPDCSSGMRTNGWIPQWLLYTLMVAVLAISFGALAATYGFIEDWNVQRRQAAIDAAAVLVRCFHAICQSFSRCDIDTEAYSKDR